MNHYKQDKIHERSLIQKYQILLKETHTDRSKSNNNFDDNFKINLENRLKEVINSSDLLTSNNNITTEKILVAVNKLNNLSAPGQNMYTLN